MQEKPYTFPYSANQRGNGQVSHADKKLSLLQKGGQPFLYMRNAIRGLNPADCWGGNPIGLAAYTYGLVFPCVSGLVDWCWCYKAGWKEELSHIANSISAFDSDHAEGVVRGAGWVFRAREMPNRWTSHEGFEWLPQGPEWRRSYQWTQSRSASRWEQIRIWMQSPSCPRWACDWWENQGGRYAWWPCAP